MVDGKAPVMTFDKQYEESYSVNERVELIIPNISDNDVTSENTLTVSASFNGQAVVIENNTIVLANVGEYLVTYTCVDKSGNTAIETFILLNSGEDQIKPVIQLSGKYAETYKVGETVNVIQPTVSDNSGVTPTVAIEIVQNGKILEMKDNKIIFEETGEVFLLYTVTDGAGNVTSEMCSFVVVGEETNNGGSTVLIILLSVGGVILVGGSVLAVVFLKKKKSGRKQNEEKEK